MVTVSHPTYGWLSLHTAGRQLVAELDDGKIQIQARTRTDGDYKRWRFIRDFDELTDNWMLLVLNAQRDIVGQTFGRTLRDVASSMNALFRQKGISITLTVR
jgi:hypothetical protein